VSSGHLDGLLNVSFTADNFSGGGVQSYSASGTAPNQFFTSIAASSTGAPGPGFVSGETAQITAVDDSNDSITVAISGQGAPTQFPYFIIGFSTNALLLSTTNADANVDALNSGGSINGLIGILTPNEVLPAETNVSFSDSGTFTGVTPCFARGTLIMAATGEIPVETLQPGDLVFAYLLRRLVPIRWIGHRTVQFRPRYHGCPAASVIVHQNAFGPSLPSRDLVLSPDHSVYIHGKLVPVRYLTNAATIAWGKQRK
jgi:hypothetical protein